MNEPKPTLDISLYHIETGLAELIQYRAERVAEIDGPLAEGELDAIDSEIRKYQMATPAKVAGVAAIFRSWRAHRDTAKAEIGRLKKIVAHLEAMEDRLKEYVADVLAMLPEPKKGPRKLTGADGSVLSLRGNGGVQPLTISDETLVPDEYKIMIVTMPMSVWLTVAAEVERSADPAALKQTTSVNMAALREALEQPCEACGGNPSLVVAAGAGESSGCATCGGSGRRGVPGARLEARGQHVEVR